MKSLLLHLALLAAVVPAWAQTDSQVEADRVRIAAERKQVDAGFVTQEVACYRKFAVNDCLKAARAQRREHLADLRRQELSLNEAQREGRAGERLRSIEERNSAQKQEDGAAQRAESVQRQQDKQQELAKRAADRAQTQASAPARAARVSKESRDRQASTRTARELRTHNAADELRRSQERQQQAQERRERVARRQAEAAKSGVKPLPVPP
jgi:colicin import membrane protein